jgi:hypothetical protein
MRVGLLLAAPILGALASAQDFQTGDVVASISNGLYNVYDNDGNFLFTLNDTLGGFTTGSFYDTTNDLLYTTNFSATIVTVFDGLDPHPIVDTINTGLDGGSSCESIVFNVLGHFYVGHANSGTIQEYDAAGTFVDSDSPALELRGADWIDLAADQSTMFYTSEGDRIMRYNVVADVQLADFANLGTFTNAYAFRLLPPFDGTGGLIVADTNDVRRLDGAGVAVQFYDAPGENAWFAMNLDPNGTSFWAGDFGTDNFYRFNIASGAIEVGPINVGPGFTLFGLSVVGEISGGQNNPPIFEDPTPCGQKLDLTIGDPFSYTVTASDVDLGDIVTLTSSAIPPGATHTPPLPQVGNPVSTQFDWTPGPGDVGQYVITYNASDGKESADCRVILNVLPACPDDEAATETQGVPCGATLSVTDPVLGTSCTMTVDGNTPLAPGRIMMSLPGPGGIFYQGCEIFLQPGGISTLASFTTDLNGDASVTRDVPFVLGKCGLRITLQAIVFGDQGPLGIGEISNGVLCTLGS